ncbi:hypothetical protein ACFFSY_05800 [Paenibacillus aurantiacus]|uniref:Uncharacterized protein n=1 Tax=Paenibacillus aurantiacus TaxID=1936118 RepID=A0ABV5KMT3_9BACL
MNKMMSGASSDQFLLPSEEAASLRIELLRPVEQLCYEIAHYLLGNAKDAAAASEEALLALYQQPRFVRTSDEERRRMARAEAIRCSLALSCCLKHKEPVSPTLI